MSKLFTLSKQERLKSKKDIETLFQTGKAFFVFPFKVIYRVAENNETPLQFMVSVPKRNFKRAVDRNRLKRITREAYRLQKNELKHNLEVANKGLHIAFVFSHSEIVNFSQVQESMMQCLKQVQHKIKK